MICDAHVHVGWYPRLRPGAAEPEPFRLSPRRLCSVLRRGGVGAFVFSSTSAQAPGVRLADLHREAREVKRLWGPGAHAFLWLAGCGFDEDPSLSALGSGLYDGVKLHGGETDWLGSRARDLETVLGSAESRGLRVQVHCGEDPGTRPLEWLPVARRHPAIPFDFAHCRPADETAGAIRGAPNVWADASFCDPAAIRRLVDAGCGGRLLFGTDFPARGAYDPRGLAGLYRKDASVLAAALPPAALRDNFAAWLGTRLAA